MKGFGSDNHSGALPEVLQSLQAANVDHAPSYGTDDWTEKCEAVFRREFGESAQTYFVFNGTAANVLCLHSLVQSYESVLITSVAHVTVDECGAPEKFIGCKLISVPSRDGKLRVSDLDAYLIRRGDQHFSQVRAISITQPTEYGTIYSRKELAQLRTFAKKHGLFLHMDGSRLFNAVAALGCSLREMTEGFDAISVGGTKNGLVFGEAVVFLNPKLAENFKFKRKQAMQLPSKSRFIAAQFLALFEVTGGEPLWRRTSEHVNAMAQRLSDGLRAIKSVQVTQAVEANAVFAIFPKTWISKLRESYFFYVWDEKTFESRLMMSFDTHANDIDGFLKLIKECEAAS